MERNRLFSVTIPNFIDRILESKERRPRYYFRSDGNLPKRYQNNKKYKYKDYRGNGIFILIDRITKEPVLANPRTAGTPKYIRIKGNAFYSGFSSHHQRIKIVNAIKEYFKPYFNKISKIEKYPIKIEFIYYIYREKAQDIDNLNFAYQKCTLDLLQQINIIDNDNLDYVNELSVKVNIVDVTEERKLIINCYQND